MTTPLDLAHLRRLALQLRSDYDVTQRDDSADAIELLLDANEALRKAALALCEELARNPHALESYIDTVKIERLRNALAGMEMR